MPLVRPSDADRWRVMAVVFCLGRSKQQKGVCAQRACYHATRAALVSRLGPCWLASAVPLSRCPSARLDGGAAPLGEESCGDRVATVGSKSPKGDGSNQERQACVAGSRKTLARVPTVKFPGWPGYHEKLACTVRMSLCCGRGFAVVVVVETDGRARASKAERMPPHRMTRPATTPRWLQPPPPPLTNRPYTH